jgi:MGT family glycosyltransferase
MILALGKGFAVDDFAPWPANVHVCNWAPQLTVLKRADLMITHGGNATVKECIWMGVPMVALPLMRDQFDGAERLVQHGLGVSADIATVDAPALGRLVREVLDGPAFRERIAWMLAEFQRSNRTGLAAEVVERALPAG